MSSPAVSCSRRYTDSASTYCSRNRLITIASRNDLIPRFSVYQLGRGSDPVIVVGSTLPAVAFSIERVSSVVGGRWSVFSGQGSVVSGLWSVVGVRWSVVGGQWSVIGSPPAVLSAIRF